MSVGADNVLPLAIIDHAETLIECGRLEQATELVKKLSENDSERPMLQATATAMEGQLLIAADDLIEARVKIKEAFDQLARSTRNPRLAERMNVLLIDCDLRDKNYEAAETDLQNAYARIRRRRVFLTMDRRRTVRKLIELYEVWDRPEELEHWQKVLQGADRG